ncbi:MAG TPA: TIGR03435 family protein [Bryobacteraceae bacterium]|nr:TIGR03435 family protein [Bryobacteraceae bacterium]
MAVLLGVSAWICGTARAVSLGEKAPELTLGTVVTGNIAAAGARHATLLEFWATWCAPCREAIPHMNALADQFKNRPIEFLSLTDEAEDKVREFLKDHPIEGVVALDPNGAIERRYDVRGVPTIVLITESGKVAAITDEALRITRAVLEELLDGREIDLPFRSSTELPRRAVAVGTTIHDESAAVRVVITPVAGKSTGLDIADDRIETRSASLPELLEFAYDTSTARMVIPDGLKERTFAVQAWVPQSSTNLLKPLVQNALVAAADLDVQRVRRKSEVVVVTGFPGRMRMADEGSRRGGSRPGHLEGHAWGAEKLRQQIENLMNRPVTLEDAGNQTVDYDVSWDAAKPGAFEAAMRDQLGLQLRSEQREIEVLVVEQRGKQQP